MFFIFLMSLCMYLFKIKPFSHIMGFLTDLYWSWCWKNGIYSHWRCCKWCRHGCRQGAEPEPGRPQCLWGKIHTQKNSILFCHTHLNWCIGFRCFTNCACECWNTMLQFSSCSSLQKFLTASCQCFEMTIPQKLTFSVGFIIKEWQLRSV